MLGMNVWCAVDPNARTPFFRGDVGWRAALLNIIKEKRRWASGKSYDAACISPPINFIRGKKKLGSIDQMSGEVLTSQRSGWYLERKRKSAEEKILFNTGKNILLISKGFLWINYLILLLITTDTSLISINRYSHTYQRANMWTIIEDKIVYKKIDYNNLKVLFK